MTDPAILAIDQGTTSSRAIVFDRAGEIVAVDQQEFAQHFPRDGWVEHDAEEIWQTVVETSRQALAQARAAGFGVEAVGITNQRETTVIWDRKTGKPIHNAVVWQDRRGAGRCRDLIETGHAPEIREKTGLVVDSYFSATKIEWLLTNVDGAQAAAESGDLAFGTIDSFLLWRLTGGGVHATDATNAARTMLFDIGQQRWDPTLCDLFGVPAGLLPDVRDSNSDFGTTLPDLFDAAIPIAGIAGDQQAAVVGQGCLQPGMAKSTYGTGCFILVNAGETTPSPAEGILSTVAYRVDGTTTYALEGSIFNAGTTIKWLRDSLGLIDDAASTGALAGGLTGNDGVYLVPSFTGLGAPYWDPDARGGLFGLTRDTGKAHLVRAALEACGYQTADLLNAMESGNTNDRNDAGERLRVDGGMAANDWLMQFIADIIEAPVERPVVTETTALGAALLAGFGAGMYDSLEDAVAVAWHPDRSFEPRLAAAARGALLDGWHKAVARVRTDTA